MQVECQEPAWSWFEDLDDAAQRRVAKIADQLEMMGRGLLGTKYAKKLTNHSFLHELVIDFRGVPFRPSSVSSPTATREPSSSSQETKKATTATTTA